MWPLLAARGDEVTLHGSRVRGDGQVRIQRGQRSRLTVSRRTEMSALFALPSSPVPLMLMRRSLLFLFRQRAQLRMLTVSICPILGVTQKLWRLLT